jgi:hypothetical protein
MARIRCNACGADLEVLQANRSKSCGCDNQTLLRLDRSGMPIISGIDLSLITAIDGVGKPKEKKVDTTPVSGYTRRIPRKLDFEVR